MYSLNIWPPLSSFFAGFLVGPCFLENTLQKVKEIVSREDFEKIESHERTLKRGNIAILVSYIGAALLCFILI